MSVTLSEVVPVRRAPFAALRLHGNNDLRLDTVEPLECGQDEVRIKVAYCGICGSDLHEWHNGPILAPQVDKSDRLTGVALPITMGHEISGTITEVGTLVDELVVGQNVAVHPALHDGEYGKESCGSCQAGRFNLCENVAYYGLGAPCGGFGREMVVKAKNAFVLPSNLSLKEGALVEPLTVAWHSVRTSGIRAGEDAVVLGAGPIGLGIISVLRFWGARAIIVSEIGAQRKEYARKLGADVVVDPSDSRVSGEGDPVVAAARRMSADNAGVHVAFDATGQQSTIESAIASVRPGGTIFNVAVHKKPVVIDINSIFLAEKVFTGGIGASDDDFRGVIESLASGRLNTDGYITAIVRLSDAIEGGLQELSDNKDHHIKILIEPE